MPKEKREKLRERAKASSQHRDSVGAQIAELQNPGRFRAAKPQENPLALDATNSANKNAGKSRKSKLNAQNSMDVDMSAADASGTPFTMDPSSSGHSLRQQKIREHRERDGMADSDSEDEKESYLPAALSKRILQRVAEQQQEIEDEDTLGSSNTGVSQTLQRMVASKKGPNRNRSKAALAADATSGGGNAGLTGGLFDVRSELASGGAGGVDGEDDNEELLQGDTLMGDEEFEMELDPEDEKALAMFNPQGGQVRRTLADIIMAKIAEKEQGANTEEALHRRLDPQVVQVYTEVGRFLQYFKSGKIPQAFKIIPTLKNWEEVLYLTDPDKWSSATLFFATKLFASNLKQKMAQRFYNLVLLPRFQRDISEKKKLHFHLYQALKKTIYKPAAFFKGILLPLAEEGCTLREAVIMSSILQKCSIPAMHSSVALLKLAKLPYQGTNCLFMKTLLDKKYSLPFQVIDQLTKYFVQFGEGGSTMPVIWHQNLLTFVQRYKNDLTARQRNSLKALLRVQNHHLLTPEIRRELLSVGDVSAAALGRIGGASNSGMQVDLAQQPLSSVPAAFSVVPFPAQRAANASGISKNKRMQSGDAMDL